MAPYPGPIQAPVQWGADSRSGKPVCQSKKYRMGKYQKGYTTKVLYF